MSEPAQYCGSGKMSGGQYPSLQFALRAEDVQTLFNNLDNGWVNITVGEKRNKVEGKPTHYLKINTWKPDPNRNQGGNQGQNNQQGNQNNFQQNQGQNNNQGANQGQGNGYNPNQGGQNMGNNQGGGDGSDALPF